MRSVRNRSTQQPGPGMIVRFTLVEVVAIIVVAGIVAAIIAPYLGGVLRRTIMVPETLAESLELVTVMERIAYDYETDPALHGDLDAFRTKVLSVPPEYGSYEVVTCAFIAYDSGTGDEVVTESRTDNLKVTIRNSSSILTQVFPDWSLP